jgi:hypothetical protein
MLHRPSLGLLLALSFLSLLGCVDATVGDAPSDAGIARRDTTLRVDFETELRTVPPFAYGMHTSVYDNALHDPELPAQVAKAGLGLFRYPGGGYSDNYHWSTHSMTPWSPGNAGYLAAGSDFGSYVGVVENADVAMMITVNYGSNLQGSGPGEPAEAAAWVAYANGDPDDAKEIGLDGVGNDWRTVGFWASVRASAPVAQDDGYNFLRIEHPEPLAIQYWEVGNEIFGNGYYEPEFELDLHAPRGEGRRGNPELSGTKYGQELRRWVSAMKAVDASIKVGAVLSTVPYDESTFPGFTEDVLSGAGDVIDFGIVHWYVEDNPARLLRAPAERAAAIIETVREYFDELGGADPERLEIALTEVGPGQNYPRGNSHAAGIFAADVYLTMTELGVMNVDWLELHSGTFMSERGDLGHAYHGIRMAHLTAAPGDVLVSADVNTETVRAHAAKRSDGSVAILLFNMSERHVNTVKVELAGLGAVADRGELYEYAPGEGDSGGVVVGPSEITELGERFELVLPPRVMKCVTIPAE